MLARLVAAVETQVNLQRACRSLLFEKLSALLAAGWSSHEHTKLLRWTASVSELVCFKDHLLAPTTHFQALHYVVPEVPEEHTPARTAWLAGFFVVPVILGNWLVTIAGTSARLMEASKPPVGRAPDFLRPDEFWVKFQRTFPPEVLVRLHVAPETRNRVAHRKLSGNELTNNGYVRRVGQNMTRLLIYAECMRAISSTQPMSGRQETHWFTGCLTNTET